METRKDRPEPWKLPYWKRKKLPKNIKTPQKKSKSENVKRLERC